MSVEGKGDEGVVGTRVRIVGVEGLGGMDMVVGIVGEVRVGIENVEEKAVGIVEVVIAGNAVVEVVSTVGDGKALKVSQQ